MKFVIADYNPEWTDRFNAEQKIITEALKNFSPFIDHIGSTSVPELGAKNIIDILVGLNDEGDLDKIIEPMITAGYVYYKLYEDEMPYRRYFVRVEAFDSSKKLETPRIVETQEDRPPLEDFKRLTHIHCITKNTHHWMRHIAFRDYLIAHPDIRDEYCELKKEISKKHYRDMLDYNDAKDSWVKATERKAIEWYNENEIKDKNVSKILKDGYNKIAESYSEGRRLKKEINYKYFDSLNNYFPKSGKLLDLGCGGAVPASSYFYEKGFDITGVDISPNMITLAKKNIPDGKFFVSDMLDCNFPAEEFDIIISTFAIIHVPQHKQKVLFEKIFKWLKNDGTVYLVLGYTNNKEEINDNWRGVKMYWSHFSAEEYKMILNEIGFKIVWEEIDVIPNDTTFYNIILKK